jgi:hypothetical protein
MAENTKQPPKQDQPQRMPQGGPSKPQKPGVDPVNNPGGGRQGVNNPGKPGPEMDPDRARPDRNQPAKPDKIGVDDDDDDEAITPPIDRA